MMDDAQGQVRRTDGKTSLHAVMLASAMRLTDRVSDRTNAAKLGGYDTSMTFEVNSHLQIRGTLYPSRHIAGPQHGFIKAKVLCRGGPTKVLHSL